MPTKSPETLLTKVSETRENFADMGHLAKEAVQEKFDAGKEKLNALEQSLVERVQESPIKSLLIAAGVGLLLGFVVRRSR